MLFKEYPQRDMYHLPVLPHQRKSPLQGASLANRSALTLAELVLAEPEEPEEPDSALVRLPS